MGYAALSAGNQILIDTSSGEVPIGVEEVCNGLSMLLTFFALSTAVAIIIQRPLLDKLIVVVSAIPIALIVNLGRILVTALVLVHFQGTSFSTWMNEKAHDYAGYAMMPVALLLLLFELKLLSWLLIDVEAKRMVSPLGIPRGGASRRTAAKAAPPKETIKKAPAL
jgi:exosortase/archaeosortase family protein